jgi:hypothetical protein
MRVMMQFQMSVDLVLGKAKTFVIKRVPDDTFITSALLTNVPKRKFCKIEQIKFNQANVLVGEPIDCYFLTPMAQISLIRLSLPLASNKTEISIIGSYSGRVPKGYQRGEKFEFMVAFQYSKEI